MFSIYTSAFNVNKERFSWKAALKSYSSFVGDEGEVVVCVNTSIDNSQKDIESFAKEFTNVKVISSNFSYEDPDLDGKVKDKALQSTSRPYKIGLDLDEYIPLRQKLIWERYAKFLSSNIYLDALFIPSLNLYGDKDRVSSVTYKWYLHNQGLKRGTVNFAKNNNGTHDITKSDSCELLQSNGDLAKSAHILSLEASNCEKLSILAEHPDCPFVVHLGYLDLERRNNLNQNFWQNHWSVESGTSVELPSYEKLVSSAQQCFSHNLPIFPFYG